MSGHLFRPLTLVLTGLAIISCSDETTSPTPVADRTTGVPDFVAASIRWVSKANMPLHERSGLTSAVVPNSAGQPIVYAIGGSTGGSLSTVQAYNASTNTWTWKKPMPLPLYWTNGAGVINGKIYLSGGVSRSRTYHAELFMYDPARNTWTQKRAMPGMSFGGVTGVMNNKLYVLTQCEQEDCFPFSRGSFYRYDPATDQWATLAPPPTGYRTWSMGDVIGGKFYVTSHSNGQPELWMYNPTTNAWTSKTPLSNRRWLGAGVAVNGKLYVIGGYTELPDGSNPAVRTVSVYNPATNSWTNVHGLPSPRTQITASRVVLGGRQRIHVIGGARPNNLQYTP
jgi:N-acetylneuraminic acid mutarotase